MTWSISNLKRNIRWDDFFAGALVGILALLGIAGLSGAVIMWVQLIRMVVR